MTSEVSRGCHDRPADTVAKIDPRPVGGVRMAAPVSGSTLDLIPPAFFVARTSVGAILLIAGSAKLLAGQDRTVRAVLGYELLPSRLVVPAARALPWVEVIVGGALISGQVNVAASFAGLA